MRSASSGESGRYHDNGEQTMRAELSQTTRTAREMKEEEEAEAEEGGWMGAAAAAVDDKAEACG